MRNGNRSDDGAGATAATRSAARAQGEPAADPTGHFRLDARVVLVTGGSGNLGAAVCKALAAAGATVVIASRDVARCERVATMIVDSGGTAVAQALDLADPASIETAITGIIESQGRLDVLVNNAITHLPGDLETYPLEDWEASLRVDATGWFRVTQLALVQMLRQGSGSIVSIASILGRVGPDERLYAGRRASFRPHYFFVKAGVVGFTRYIATTYGHRGIRANAVSPGGIETDPPRSDVSAFSDRVPMRRLAHPDEVAAAVRFLSSDAASYITGHDLVVDGGYTAW